MEPPSTSAASAPSNSSPVPPAPPRRSGWRIFFILCGVFLLGCGIAAATTAWWVKRNFYASRIEPVTLTQTEQKTLEAKLHVLDSAAPGNPTNPAASPGEQERTLLITSREINAYLAQQNLGDRLKVDLGQDNISATLLVPVPPDAGLPLVSGTTLRLSLALNARMNEQGHAELQLRDVRVGGVPLPNAWLGDLKGVNLTSEGLQQDPGLKRFLAGIQDLKITPEGLRVVLAE